MHCRVYVLNANSIILCVPEYIIHQSSFLKTNVQWGGYFFRYAQTLYVCWSTEVCAKQRVYYLWNDNKKITNAMVCTCNVIFKSYLTFEFEKLFHWPIFVEKRLFFCCTLYLSFAFIFLLFIFTIEWHNYFSRAVLLEMRQWGNSLDTI